MNESPDLREQNVRFLLQEFGQLDSERLRLKGEAVQRLNFFLTLTSAILGGLVLFGQSSVLIGVQYVALVALLFLSMIGWYTLEYIVGREINTDRVLRAGARIRRYFTNSDPSIQQYLMWPDHDGPTGYITHNNSAIRRTIEAVLSFLLAASAGLLLGILNLIPSTSVVIGIISFILFLVGFEFYASRRFKRAVKKAEAEQLHSKRAAQTAKA